MGSRPQVRAVRITDGLARESQSWASLSPAMVVLDDFLSQEECEQLQALASGDLRRSRVTDGMISNGRTSFSTFFTGVKSLSPLVLDIERRLKEVVTSAHVALLALEGEETVAQAKPHFVAAEPLQVVRYSAGQGATSSCPVTGVLHR